MSEERGRLKDSHRRSMLERPRSTLGDVTLAPPTFAPPRSPSPLLAARSPSPLRNPFNFESISASPARPSPARTSQRRGHRYKHSSVSINFFQEPEVRAPLAIPVSHEIPTARESWQSASKRQTLQFGYSLLRVVLVWALFAGPHASHSVSAFAHLVAYDVVADLVVAAVTVLGNFEVWTSSSLRLPFALQRAETLVGFALSITLVFFGFDIFSHVIQDLAQQLAGQGHVHHHGRPDEHHHGTDPVGLVLLLLNEATVCARLVRLENPLAENTIGSVTTLFGLLVLVLPLLPELLDTILTPLMALSMVYFGWQVSKYYGGMLVMSHVGRDNTAELDQALGSIKGVTLVSDISLWQVHQDLWLASAKIVMAGTDADETRVRLDAESAMRRILVDVTKLETTIDISRTTLD